MDNAAEDKKNKSAKIKIEPDYLKHRTRMRERYKKHGLEGFLDYEVLEFLLYYSLRRGDTKKLAKRILAQFGGKLHLVFEANQNDLMKRCKISDVTAILMTMIVPAYRRYFESKWGGRRSFENTHQLGEFAKHLFIGKIVEHIYVICFDARLRMVHHQCVAVGTVDQVALYPRELLRVAVLEHQASYVAMAHNHPAGSVELTREDLDTTAATQSIMNELGVTLLDHIIVAGDDFVSFAQRGYLQLPGIDGVNKSIKKNLAPPPHNNAANDPFVKEFTDKVRKHFGKS